jgi:hypothetical protein
MIKFIVWVMDVVTGRMGFSLNLESTFWITATP